VSSTYKTAILHIGIAVFFVVFAQNGIGIYLEVRNMEPPKLLVQGVS